MAEFGQRIERNFGVLTGPDIRRYAEASGDRNPVHCDEAYAKSVGYPGVLAHGMLTAGLLATFLVEWFEDALVHEFSVRFVEQVFAGDCLAAVGEVSSQSADASLGGRLRAELTLVNQHGASVVTGSAIVQLRPVHVEPGSHAATSNAKRIDD